MTTLIVKEKDLNRLEVKPNTVSNSGPGIWYGIASELKYPEEQYILPNENIIEFEHLSPTLVEGMDRYDQPYHFVLKAEVVAWLEDLKIEYEMMEVTYKRNRFHSTAKEHIYLNYLRIPDRDARVLFKLTWG